MNKLFANLNIRNKVIFAFALLLSGSIALGLFSIERLSAVDAAAATIRDTWLPATRVLGRLAQIAELIRGSRATLLLASTDAERARPLATIPQQTRLLGVTLLEYRRLVTTVEEQRLADAIDSTWNHFTELTDTADRLLVDGKREEATHFFLIDVARALDGLRDSLQADVALAQVLTAVASLSRQAEELSDEVQSFGINLRAA